MCSSSAHCREDASGREMPVAEAEQDSRAIRSWVPRATFSLPDHAYSGHAVAMTASCQSGHAGGAHRVAAFRGERRLLGSVLCGRSSAEGVVCSTGREPAGRLRDCTNRRPRQEPDTFAGGLGQVLLGLQDRTLTDRQDVDREGIVRTLCRHHRGVSHAAEPRHEECFDPADRVSQRSAQRTQCPVAQVKESRLRVAAGGLRCAQGMGSRRS
jgi:hypothetical protein